MNSEAFHVRELDSRVSGGTQVRILWSSEEGAAAVAVDDGRTGDAFTLDVCAGERALDVFHHPYAYAAVGGIETRAAALVAA